MDSAAASMVAMSFCGSNPQLIRSSNTRNFKPPCNPLFQTRTRSHGRSIYSSSSKTTCYALLSETSAAISEPETVNITWQIIVGTIAGITPFTVAGIEFSKRIVKQRQCQTCNGSGLVLMSADKKYAKCPTCGGWLPWQSWKRFFTG